MNEHEFQNKVRGALLGTAIGDALGFIAERLSCAQIKRSFGKVTRFYVIGKHGFVSDDTEQSALVAYSLAKNPCDSNGCLEDFRRSLLFWYLSLPFGIGRATIQACTRIAIGMKESGVNSAGNGAAMRAALIGAFFYDYSCRVQAAAYIADQ
jgi:ADP-ribosylglycohydrolase